MAKGMQVTGTLRLAAQVRNPIQVARAQSVVLRIDTGAEMALLDTRVIQAIGVTPVTSQVLQGISGTPQRVPIYRVTLDLGARGTLRHVQVAGWTLPPSASAQGLFGDNLLRQGLLVYNGPRDAWSFQVGR